MVCYMNYPVAKFFSTDSKWARWLYNKWIRPTCFWNGSILFLQEAYFELFLIATLNLRILSRPWSTWEITFTNVFSIIAMTVMLFLPMFIFFYIWPKYRPSKDIMHHINQLQE